MERYEEALTDFTRAIELDEKNDWVWYDNALVHFLTNQMDDFYSDIHNALNIAKIQLNDSPPQSIDYYRIRFNMALYLLIEGSIEYALDEYYQLFTTCSDATRLKNAIKDLKEFLAIQPMNVSAQQIIHQIEDRIHQLENNLR
jgi:tetratricopeptide (TPR) repeat protein